MTGTKKTLIFANQNNGYNITNYLIHRKDADIVKIVTYEDSENQWWKSVKQLAVENGLDYIIYDTNERLYQQVKDLDVDLLLSINWRNKVPPKILKIPKIGCVNFHNSLLPKHRGVYANTWPILLGEEKAGVTLHWMLEELDSGDIICQESFKTYPWETAKDVWEKMNEHFLRMFKKIWPKVDDWKRISYPQKGESSYHSLKDFGETNCINLDEKKKISDFINFLKAKTFEPYYKNAFFIDPQTGKKVYISINLEVEEK